MKNRKRLPALLLCLALIASLCACKPDGQTDSSETPSSTGPGASQAPSAAPSIEVDRTQNAVTFAAGLSPTDALLVINGEAVRADLFLYLLFMDCYNFESYYYYYGVTVADYAGMLLEDTVNMALYYTILRQRAAELGCLPTDAQMQEAKDKLSADRDSLKTAYGLSDESIDHISSYTYYYQNLLGAVPAPTEEDLNNYVYQVKHILLMTVDTEGEPVLRDDGTYAYPALSDETVAEKRRQAEDILARLQAVEGEERLSLFDELMNQYSEDSGLAHYPDGYEYTVEDSLVGGFTEAALALEAGGLSGIVETDYGYHIMLRGEVADLESYAEACREHQLSEELNSLMETAKVTPAPALDTLDVAGFYERYIAYQSAVLEQDDAAEGGSDAG